MSIPHAEQRTLNTPHGPAVGVVYSWPGGQYCAIHAYRGVLGCGVYDIACADEFGMAFAICKGTPEHPLRTPEDLYPAKIVAVSKAAAELGIEVGMTGEAALAYLIPQP
ncbi:MAG: DUF1805 domain-containing protein [Planctomycetaceae bacterium]